MRGSLTNAAVQHWFGRRSGAAIFGTRLALEMQRFGYNSTLMRLSLRRSHLWWFGACLLLLAGAEPLRPWGARSVDRAQALLVRVEALEPAKPVAPTPIAPIHTVSSRKASLPRPSLPLTPALPPARPRPLTPLLLLPRRELPLPIPVQAPPRPMGAAALGPIALADLDGPDPLLPAGPPAPQVRVRLPVAGLCRPEQVRLLVERQPGGALRGEPRWLSGKPSLPLERRLQAWLDQPIPGAPSRQLLLVEGLPLPLREDQPQRPRCR